MASAEIDLGRLRSGISKSGLLASGTTMPSYSDPMKAACIMLPDAFPKEPALCLTKQGHKVLDKLISFSDTCIAICDRHEMRLGEKIRYLRSVEGTLRGLGREMTQQEVIRAVRKELRKTISQSYLSQIESGARPHLTNRTRMMLAKFFKV